MNEAVKLLIVEDEAIVAMDLSMRLLKEGYEVVGTADNGDEAIRLFNEHTPDLVLMDININGDKDGIETAKAVKKIREVPLIFLTAFSQTGYVDRAKAANPSAYLVKPFNNDSLYTSIEIALHNFALLKQSQSLPPKETATTDATKEPLLFFNQYFFVKDNYRFTKIAVSDLLYVRADNNYIILVTKDKKLTIRISLQAFADTISHQHLVRVHRGYIVNMQNIESFNDEEIIIGKHEIPIGRTYKDDFLKSFNYL